MCGSNIIYFGLYGDDLYSLKLRLPLFKLELEKANFLLELNLTCCSFSMTMKPWLLLYGSAMFAMPLFVVIFLLNVECDDVNANGV